MKSKKPFFVSVVVPSYNEEENIEEFFKQVKKHLKGFLFEVIFVNDGSGDSTLEVIKSLSSKNAEVRYVSFSRNFGHQAALRAGLRHAKGDAVISMDADLQHPPQLLPKLLEKWTDGYEIVYTIRKDTVETPLFKRITSRLYYKIINFLSDLSISEGAADFRLLDRKVVNVINEQQEPNLFLRGYINWIGFKQYAVDYEPAARFKGTSKYTFKKMLNLAISGVSQFSTKPLKLSFTFAALALTVSFIYLIYAIAMAIAGNTIPGWLSLVFLIVFLQGVQFLILGLIGGYIGGTFMQTKHRPDFIISETNCEVDK